MFSDRLLNHFEHPRNAGELAGPTAVIEVSNPVCGDLLRLAVIVENGVVSEARFLCRGCAAAIASGSALTEKLVGHTAAEVQAIDAAGIAAELGGLPPASAHAAQLAEDGARAIAAKMQSTAH